MQKASYTKADYAVEEAIPTIPVNVAMTSKTYHSDMFNVFYYIAFHL